MFFYNNGYMHSTQSGAKYPIRMKLPMHATWPTSHESADIVLLIQKAEKLEKFRVYDNFETLKDLNVDPGDLAIRPVIHQAHESQEILDELRSQGYEIKYDPRYMEVEEACILFWYWDGINTECTRLLP